MSPNHRGGYRDKDGNILAQEALKISTRVLDRQNEHERFCEERFDGLKETLMQANKAILQKIETLETSYHAQRLIEVREQTRLQVRQNILWSVLTFLTVFGLQYLIG